MKSVFRDILLEREFSAPIAYVQREETYALLPQKALAVIGIRRAGKTTFLRQIWDEISASGKIQPERLLYVNFFDERLFNLQGKDLGQLLEAFYELHPQVPASDASSVQHTTRVRTTTRAVTGVVKSCTIP